MALTFPGEARSGVGGRKAGTLCVRHRLSTGAAPESTGVHSLEEEEGPGKGNRKNAGEGGNESSVSPWAGRSA